MSTRRPTDPPPEPGTPSVDPMLEVRERSRGQRPGDAYVRIVRPFEKEFEHGESGQLIASEKTIGAASTTGRVFQRVRSFLFGRPISSEHEEHERLTKVKALAIFSSDNISSSAYATEEIMRILILAGVSAIALTMPITVAIVIVLIVVAISYRQTIRAYPDGASSYIVASDNLGTGAGLLAGSALLIDYTLTVAVSVSAGVAALTSFVPDLYPYRVPIAVTIVLLLTAGNLRGIRESGSIFMAPTYLYMVVIFGVIAWGLFQAANGTLGTFVPPEAWVEAEEAEAIAVLSVFLVLRAFSSGAAALTGVEAISDGVPAFKTPEWRNARTTLTWAAILFGALFLGISYLASVIHVVPDPTEQQTVLSLITREVAGDGWYLIVVQVATALVLILAANTAFADFPRLASFLARDGFMPRQFGFRGDRLAFTTGIAALTGLAIILLVVFGASVNALIPLYTLGVFVAFTLSQSGMVVRWWQRREPGWARGIIINGLGAVTTAVIATVVVTTKFLSGAWIVVLLIPVLIGLMVAIRSHYRHVEKTLAPAPGEVVDVNQRNPIVIVPIARLDRPALRAVSFARSLSAQASAIHVTNDAEGALSLREEWTALGNGMELVVVESPYRALIGPLLRYMDALQAQDPTRPVVVVLSEIVPRHWWENLLHNQSSLRLKLRLFGRRNTIVADVPYHID